MLICAVQITSPVTDFPEKLKLMLSKKQIMIPYLDATNIPTKGVVSFLHTHLSGQPNIVSADILCFAFLFHCMHEKSEDTMQDKSLLLTSRAAEDIT